MSCYRGFHCAPGAEGVGRAATAAFVLSFVIILMLDLFLSIGLDRVHDHAFGRRSMADDRPQPPTERNRIARAKRPTALIELHDLSVAFGRQPVLRDMTLSIPRGQTLAIIGESGCGKTVLLKRSSACCIPTSGHVVFDGQRIDELNDKELTAQRARFGFVFQNAALFDSMTIAENVAFPLRENRRHDGRRRPSRSSQQRLAEVGLADERAAASGRRSSPAACGSASAWPGPWR